MRAGLPNPALGQNVDTSLPDYMDAVLEDGCPRSDADYTIAAVKAMVAALGPLLGPSPGALAR